MKKLAFIGTCAVFAVASSLRAEVNWEFPLTYSQEGLPFADGVQGERARVSNCKF